MIEQEGYKPNAEYQMKVQLAIWNAITDASAVTDVDGETTAMLASTEILKALAMVIAYVLEMSPYVRTFDQAGDYIEGIANETLEAFRTIREKEIGIRQLVPNLEILGPRQ